MDRKSDPRHGEVLFEFTRIGGQMRVAAIHAATGIEVVAIAPASATRQQLQQLVLAKLRRRMGVVDDNRS